MLTSSVNLRVNDLQGMQISWFSSRKTWRPRQDAKIYWKENLIKNRKLKKYGGIEIEKNAVEISFHENF